MSNPKKLAGKVAAAPNKSLGFDTNTPLNYDTAKSFYNEGYRFAIRYVSRKGSEDPGDITYEEANAILEAGLALMPVQHVLSPGWHPSGELGTKYGNDAAINADHIGFPPRVNVWCDLEGVAEGTHAQSVIDYCNNWYDAVAKYGYLPGLYVGANSILSSKQLYYDLKFKHFWKSQSTVPEVAERSYQMVQRYPSETVNGISIDIDTTYIDKKGGQPQWLIRG
ncbi:MAG: DUF1906 domain-containing protein [Xenococcus sp. MO_188.B8]|nr:DUF1906 domain-containing protein [Xenococcus sp. MO_188.B8]